MRNKPGCQARQFNDEMRCDRCNLVWDVNDDDPPDCVKEQVATKALDTTRNLLAPRTPATALLHLSEMPLNWLPSVGVGPGLALVKWTSYPNALFVSVRRPYGQGAPTQGRDYIFYDAAGKELFEVQVREDFSGRKTTMRQGHAWSSI